MKNIPKRIYLNVGSDNLGFDPNNEDTDFSELVEVTWSEGKIHESDLCYVRDTQWIKIESEADLPTEHREYVVRLKSGKVKGATYYAESKRFYTGGNINDNPVTHWMHLPRSPKED